MSRKTRAETGEDAPADATKDGDLHGFWDRSNLDTEDNDEAFAVVIDPEGEHDPEVDTLTSLGDVTQVDAEELDALAAWADAKACRNCRRKIAEHHDPALLRHDECRTALRVGRLLRRYQ